jgi:hypothetical protein
MIPGIVIFKCLFKLGDEVFTIGQGWAVIMDEGAEKSDHF